jgi:hypothetical protein
MYHIFCVHPSVEGHLGSFWLLAIINEAAMNRVEHGPLLHVGASSVYMLRSDIAGYSGDTMSNFLRNHQTDFKSRKPVFYKTSIGYTSKENEMASSVIHILLYNSNTNMYMNLIILYLLRLF